MHQDSNVKNFLPLTETLSGAYPETELAVSANSGTLKASTPALAGGWPPELLHHHHWSRSQSYHVSTAGHVAGVLNSLVSATGQSSPALGLSPVCHMGLTFCLPRGVEETDMGTGRTQETKHTNTTKTHRGRGSDTH